MTFLQLRNVDLHPSPHQETAFADFWILAGRTARVTNQEVLFCAALPGTEALIMQTQMRWSGHRMHTEDTQLPKTTVLLCTRKQGRPIE